MALPITTAQTSLAVSSISALAQAGTAVSSLTGLLLASPQNTKGYQPQNPPTSTGLPSTQSAPPALLFHYEGEQTVSLSSDITDHFIEDNTALQDQISIKPIVITTHGFIGELNNIPPFGLNIAAQVANTLTTIGAYVPGLSPTALIAYNEAFAAYQLAASAVNASVSAISSLGGGTGESVIGSGGLDSSANQNRQQTYFQQFYGYWNNRTLFTVQTPWAIFQNMAILSLRAIQDAETRMITDFEVTFKMINVASTLLLAPTPSTQGRLNSQSAPSTGNGTGALAPGMSVGSGLSKMGAVNVPNPTNH